LIEVVFTPPTHDSRWDRWLKYVSKATTRLLAEVDSNNEFTIRSALYKRMRNVIFDAYHGKCVYCEARFMLDQSGDIEHYRPKAGVVDENDNVVTVSAVNGQTAPHKGYYWLAYDYCNLFPSCLKCNRLSKTRAGVLVGKGTRFPVRGFRACEPGEETKEQPLLLLPTAPGFDPASHFIFDRLTGILGGITDEAKVTIRLLDLNREGLPEERRDVYVAVTARLRAVHTLLDLLRTNPSESLRVELANNLLALKAYRLGYKAYCLAARNAMRDHADLVAPLRNQF
jgi:hypothetical protein